MTCSSTHHRDEKAPARQSLKVVRDGRKRWIAGGNESRQARIRYIEEKNLVLSLQDAQQTATSDDFAVVGEADVVRFIASCVRWRERRHRDDLAVLRRVFVEVNDGKEIGSLARLITGTDEKIMRRGIDLAALTSPVRRWAVRHSQRCRGKYYEHRPKQMRFDAHDPDSWWFDSRIYSPDVAAMSFARADRFIMNL